MVGSNTSDASQWLHPPVPRDATPIVFHSDPVNGGEAGRLLDLDHARLGRPVDASRQRVLLTQAGCCWHAGERCGNSRLDFFQRAPPKTRPLHSARTAVILSNARCFKPRGGCREPGSGRFHLLCCAVESSLDRADAVRFYCHPRGGNNWSRPYPRFAQRSPGRGVTARWFSLRCSDWRAQTKPRRHEPRETGSGAGVGVMSHVLPRALPLLLPPTW